ncbi:cobalt-zinc-cadmium resistance protein CzcA [Chitinophaga costaii]|uniref:Cobalt-zinc-cadmium resistance protein CzcA n=1 Tax=Chitinophaga costaii TaxID=1335309 RepID=A0A1C4CQ44_9BACT|nr:CusA/CzcA family heavy metal efflux RND transporter [Chitinophaga costaii]PUZ27000.1 AcrB/AcrD/AcrF family protein [Chitinophaga costaii]SCC21227.1 cobalt-zinc-cadmium resistance protein CzcA [Chitinophaga costaii]
MIRNILIQALNTRWAVIAGALVLMIGGIICFKLMKIEAYPDIADTNVIVIAPYEGRAAEEVEQQVTVPLERALNSVPNVTSRRSRTIFGLSLVQLNFEDGVSDYFARAQVNERLATAELPDGVVPELGPLTSAVGEIFRYVVEAPPTYTPMQLRDLQDWVIRPYLLQTPGVADIVTFGGPVKQFHVLTSPEKLRKYNLTLAQLMDAVAKNNQNTGGNIVERGGQGFAVRGLGALKSTQDIESIVLTNINGIPVYLRDVASVEINPPPPQGILGYTNATAHVNENSGVEGIISMRRGENPTEVLKAMTQKMKDLQDNELPKDVHLRVVYDRSTLVNYTLTTVSHTLFEGISIVIIILILFLGNIRSALVVALTIPFSLLFAFILMRLTGVPANLLSLGAIDFGIIVDGACVMAAHLIHKFKHATPEEKAEGIVKLTLNAAQEVGREIFFSVTIIILAYLPILTMQRVEGKLFSPMAITLAFAVIGSMIAALTIIPVLISFAYKKELLKTDDPHKNPGFLARYSFLSWLERKYAVAVNKVLQHSKPFLIVGFAIVFILLSLGRKVGTEFLPALDEGSIFMRSFLPAGTNIHENQKIAPVIRSIAASHPQIETVITQSGRNDDGTDPFPSNRTEILMMLKDYSGWVHDTTKAELVETIKTQIQRALPGAQLSFGQPIIDQVTEIVNGSAADLAIEISGDDLIYMRQVADSVVSIVRNIPGATETGIEQEGQQDQLSIKIDRQAAARYGINVADIQTMVEAAIGGKQVSSLYDGTKKYDVIVRYYPQERNNIDVIRSLQVPTPSGALIPMNQLADIQLTPGQTNIYRGDNKRLLTVKTNIRGRDQGSFVAEAQKKVGAAIHMPQGYTVAYGGQFENLERASKQLAIAIPLTVVIVLLVLFILFRNIRYALMTFACIFFALAGGISALLIRGYNFNVSAGVGFVSLFGISVMAGVLLISSYNREREMFPREDLRSVVSRASSQQLRAVMMMLIVAIIGLIPAAKSSGIGSDVQRPLATVIIGGLTTTLLFTPFLLPPFYYWIEQRKLNKDAKKPPVEA